MYSDGTFTKKATSNRLRVSSGLISSAKETFMGVLFSFQKTSSSTWVKHSETIRRVMMTMKKKEKVVRDENVYGESSIRSRLRIWTRHWRRLLSPGGKIVEYVAWIASAIKWLNNFTNDGGKNGIEASHFSAEGWAPLLDLSILREISSLCSRCRHGIDLVDA